MIKIVKSKNKTCQSCSENAIIEIILEDIQKSIKKIEKEQRFLLCDKCSKGLKRVLENAITLGDNLEYEE